jgi:hypothetical protein
MDLLEDDDRTLRRHAKASTAPSNHQRMQKIQTPPSEASPGDLRDNPQEHTIYTVHGERRKRGSGGGSPRKYDDVLTNGSDLVTARRAKRANGGLG